MTLLLASAAGILGAIIGSFLNALLFRFNTGRGMGGRSRCMHCSHTLRALDLVPLLSYLFLRGCCRYCGAKISLQYPLVEATMALLGVLAYLAHPQPFAFIFWFLVCALLLFVVVYDLRHTIIPWSFSLTLAGFAFLHLFINLEQGAGMLPSLGALLAGPLLALPLFLLSLVSRGTWMGWGDSVLELSLGWLLGLSAGATGLMLAFWSGAIGGLGLILFSRWHRRRSRFTMRSEIPFAPFLVLGALLAHFLHVDFFSSLMYLW